MTFIMAVLTLIVTSYDRPQFPTCAGRSIDPAVLIDLHELEQEAGVPAHRRGILAAVWCIETRWVPNPSTGDNGRAVGPLQLHPEHAARCASPTDDIGDGDPREDLQWSSRCWLRRVSEVMEKARPKCGDGHHLWDVAEAMVSSPGYAWHCGAKSSHVKLLEAWRG